MGWSLFHKMILIVDLVGGDTVRLACLVGDTGNASSCVPGCSCSSFLNIVVYTKLQKVEETTLSWKAYNISITSRSFLTKPGEH